MKNDEVSRSPTMVYVKHKDHGNRHVVATEVAGLVAAGWVVWPRTKSEKDGVSSKEPVAHPPATVDAPIAVRRPGRPPKVRA